MRVGYCEITIIKIVGLFSPDIFTRGKEILDFQVLKRIKMHHFNYFLESKHNQKTTTVKFRNKKPATDETPDRKEVMDQATSSKNTYLSGLDNFWTQN